MSRPGSGYPAVKPAGTCCVTGRRFEPGERYVAALVEGPGGELGRREYGLERWEAGDRPGADELVGFWRCVAGAPGAPPPSLGEDGVLVELFEQLAEQTDRRRRALRLVVALMLVRMKVLVHEGSRPGVMLVRFRRDARRPDGTGFIEVPDPGLDRAEAGALLAELDAMLAGASAHPGPDAAEGAETAPSPEGASGAGDPGAIDPGAIDPGAIDPGAIDPGAIDPGAGVRSEHVDAGGDPVHVAGSGRREGGRVSAGGPDARRAGVRDGAPMARRGKGGAGA